MLICRGNAPRAAKAILRFFAWRLSGRLIGQGSASDRSNFRCREGELKIDGLKFGFFFRSTPIAECVGQIGEISTLLARQKKFPRESGKKIDLCRPRA